MIAVLQFDAAGVELVERLLGEGRLPTLGALRARGTWKPLETPAKHFAASCYATLYSGLPAGEHGHHYPFVWSASEQRVRLASTIPHPEPVWDRIGRHGKRALVIDPYEAPEPAGLDGVFVSGWQFVNRVVLPPRSRPRSARRDLGRRLGRPRSLEEVFGRPSAPGLLTMRRRLLSGPARGADAAISLLSQGPFELLWLAMPPVHVGGHQLWDDSQLPEGALTPGERALIEAALAEIYAAADVALGRIVDALPDDADLMVLSPIGMTTNRSLPDLMPPLVAAIMGDVVTPQPDSSSGAWRLRGAIPTGLRGRVAAMLPARVALALTARLETPRLDWRSTRAFAVPGDVQGFVRLNMRGRERDGIVDPADADALLTELTEGLLDFRTESGDPIVARVARTSDVLAEGARRDMLPDLIVHWSEHATTDVRRVSSERHGEVVRHGAGSGRSGNHDSSAWVLLVPGRSRAVQPDRSADVVDIAPTVCSLAGVDAGDLPGTPLLAPA